MEVGIFAWLAPFILGVSFLYGSAGHGGATGYLAIFAIAGITNPAIAPMVLTLNLIVSSIGFYNFRRFGFFRLDLLWPFILTSIPAAFLGAQIPLSTRMFENILGLILLASAGIMVLSVNKTGIPPVNFQKSNILWIGIPAGLLIGLVSGAVGIGGGIFLTPLLILTGLASVKHTAAIASAFIFLNSASGLSGHLIRGHIEWAWLWPFIIIVSAGGFLGSYLAAGKFSMKRVRYLTVAVLLIAGLKLLLL